MAQIKQCDRCKKVIENDNEIGLTMDVFKVVVNSGYIRAKKLIEMAKKGEGFKDLEYLPITFRDEKFGQIELCRNCFTDFMKLKVSPS